MYSTRHRPGARKPDPDSDAEESLTNRIGYGLASSLVGAVIWTGMIFWAEVSGKWQVFALIMGVSFLGGAIIGKKFFDFVKELLHKIW